VSVTAKSMASARPTIFAIRRERGSV